MECELEKSWILYSFYKNHQFVSRILNRILIVLGVQTENFSFCQFLNLFLKNRQRTEVQNQLLWVTHLWNFKYKSREYSKAILRFRMRKRRNAYKSQEKSEKREKTSQRTWHIPESSKTWNTCRVFELWSHRWPAGILVQLFVWRSDNRSLVS